MTTGVVEIGYSINEGAWGRGLGTEAVGALVDELLSRPGVSTVTAETTAANVASQEVLKRNAFSRTGTAWSKGDGDLIRWERGIGGRGRLP